MENFKGYHLLFLKSLLAVVVCLPHLKYQRHAFSMKFGKNLFIFFTLKILAYGHQIARDSIAKPPPIKFGDSSLHRN